GSPKPLATCVVFMLPPSTVSCLQLTKEPVSHMHHCNRSKLFLSGTKWSGKTVTDLGIIFDTKLDFSQHIDTMVSEAYRRLGILESRTSEFFSELVLKVLNCVMSDPIWNIAVLSGIPVTETKLLLKEIIERIQNNFLRYLLYKKNRLYVQDVSSSLLRNILTFDEIYSIRKNKDLKTWRVPPSHDWYKRSSPGGSIGLACDRADQLVGLGFIGARAKCGHAAPIEPTRRRCLDLLAVI
ncbi:hypothetical protein AVEN_83526-1, partial [Araneus ventricosus]